MSKKNPRIAELESLLDQGQVAFAKLDMESCELTVDLRQAKKDRDEWKRRYELAVNEAASQIASLHHARIALTHDLEVLLPLKDKMKAILEDAAGERLECSAQPENPTGEEDQT